MLTSDQMKEKGVTPSYVSVEYHYQSTFSPKLGILCTEEFTSQPPVQSVRVEDILEVIDADIIIMKIDIEGYECKVDIISLTL